MKKVIWIVVVVIILAVISYLIYRNYKKKNSSDKTEEVSLKVKSENINSTINPLEIIVNKRNVVTKFDSNGYPLYPGSGGRIYCLDNIQYSYDNISRQWNFIKGDNCKGKTKVFFN